MWLQGHHSLCSRCPLRYIYAASPLATYAALRIAGGQFYASRLTAHLSWRLVGLSALRYAAESVWHGSLFAATPHGFGSLLMFEYIGVCAALQPQFDIISKPTPFACRKGVSPLTAIDTLIRCTTFAQSKWLAVPAISLTNRPTVGRQR